MASRKRLSELLSVSNTEKKSKKAEETERHYTLVIWRTTEVYDKVCFYIIPDSEISSQQRETLNEAVEMNKKGDFDHRSMWVIGILLGQLDEQEYEDSCDFDEEHSNQEGKEHVRRLPIKETPLWSKYAHELVCSMTMSHVYNLISVERE